MKILFSYEDVLQLNYVLNNWDFLIAFGFLMTTEQYEEWYMYELSKYELTKHECN